MDEPIPVIVMAGGPPSPRFAAAGEEPRPGLAAIHGRPMVAYVVDGLRAAGAVGEVILVCAPEYPPVAGVDRVVAASGNMVANLDAGLRACAGAGAALVASADIPFLTGAAVDDYARRCVATGASLCYGGIPAGAMEARFPRMPRTYVRLAEGRFTGGNVVYMRHAFWPAVAAVLEQLRAARKQPWRIAHLMGPRILLRLLSGRLAVAEIEARAAERLGGPCRAVLTEHAEIGADVDDPAALAVARTLLDPAEAPPSR